MSHLIRTPDEIKYALTDFSYSIKKTGGVSFEPLAPAHAKELTGELTQRVAIEESHRSTRAILCRTCQNKIWCFAGRAKTKGGVFQDAMTC